MPRPSRRTVAVVAAACAVAAAAVVLPLFQPWRIFTDKVVDEGLPGAVPISTPPSSAAAPTISAGRPSGTATTAQRPGSTTSKTAAPNTTAPKTTAPADAGPARIAAGRFVTHEHDTSGTVALYRLADGSHVLRLEDLDTSDGPDLRVWLTDAPVLEDRAGWHVFDDGRYASLGKLKGNHGNQNYPIPAGVDPGAFSSVSIWCDRFNVSFGAAKLAPV